MVQQAELVVFTEAGKVHVLKATKWPLGKPMSAAELDAWAIGVVNLFLNGCRGWVPAKP